MGVGVIVARILVLVVGLGLWEYGSGRWFDPFFFGSPSLIVAQWWEWVIDGTLGKNLSQTLWTAVVGFLIGAVAALVIGYLFGSIRALGSTFEPFITAIFSIPLLALVPLFVMWFGIGAQLAVLIAALVTFFLMFYNTYFGVRDVDRNLTDAVRIMGGSSLDIATKVRFPSALVWVAAGMKIAIPQSLVAVVVAEILASNRGMGYLVQSTANRFDSAGTFAALLTLLVVGLIFDRAAGLLTKRSLIWRDSTGAPN